MSTSPRREDTELTRHGSTVDEPYMFGTLDLYDLPESISAAPKTKQNRQMHGRSFTRTRTNLKIPTAYEPSERSFRTKEQERKAQEHARLNYKLEQLKASAGTYMRIGGYDKAIDLYTQALQIDVNDNEALFMRATCFYESKNFTEAVQDADRALQQDNTSAKAYGIKGESLFQTGDFEMALVAYHRASRLRPGVKEYKQGIEKAKTAIDNAIGESSGVNLDLSGDLSFFEQYNKTKSEITPYVRATRQLPQKKNQHSSARSVSDKPEQDPKTVKQLLQELYGDYVYLEGLLNEESKQLKILEEADKSEDNKQRKKAMEKKHAMTGSYDFDAEDEEELQDEKQQKNQTFSSRQRNKRRYVSLKIRDVVKDELDYLHERTEFYWQLQPLKKSARGNHNQRSDSSISTQSVKSADELIELMEDIEADHSNGKYELSLRKSEKALEFIKKQLYSNLPKRDEFEATIYSFMGNAHFELEEYRLAMKYHKQDLEVAERQNLEEARSRALDNIGRTYARLGQHEEAIAIFEEKLELAKEPLEAAWLHHELGRCYYERKQYDKAIDHGEKSLSAADEAHDNAWKLNATVLLAQSYTALEKYDNAMESFESALELANSDRDKAAQQALRNAMNDIRGKTKKYSELDENTTGEVDHAQDIKDDIEESNEEHNVNENSNSDIANEIKSSNKEEDEEAQREAALAIRDAIKESNEEEKEKEVEEAKDIAKEIRRSNEEDNDKHDANDDQPADIARLIKNSNKENKNSKPKQVTKSTTKKTTQASTYKGKNTSKQTSSSKNKKGTTVQKNTKPKGVAKKTSKATENKQKSGNASQTVKISTTENLNEEEQGTTEGREFKEEKNKSANDVQPTDVKDTIKEADPDKQDTEASIQADEGNQLSADHIQDLIKESNKEDDKENDEKAVEKDDFFD